MNENRKHSRPRGATAEGKLKWVPVATVEKYDSSGHLYETLTSTGNDLTLAGLERLADVIAKDAVGLVDGAVRLGVGDSDAPFSSADSSLGSNQYYAEMTDGFPETLGGRMSFRGEYGAGDANFAWNCWGLDISDSGSATAGSSGGDVLFNRKVFSFGIKTGGTWALTVTIDLVQS